MATRPWHRLDPGFIARCPVSRSRIDLGTPRGTPGDGAALLRRGLVTTFRFQEGKLLAQVSVPALIAARDRGLLRRIARRLPAEMAELLLKPSSAKARATLARVAEEEAIPESSPFFFHARDLKTARRLLKVPKDAGGRRLAGIAAMQAGFLDDLRAARATLRRASKNVQSTIDALGVAEAWMSIHGDRGAAARALEAGRPFAKSRIGLTRLAWGWGAVLGDDDRARALLVEADALIAPGQMGPTCARDWAALLGDVAAARATLDGLAERAETPDDLAQAALDFWHVVGDRARARAVARKGAEAPKGARWRLVIAAALAQLKDKAGAKAQIEAAERETTEASEIAWIADLRATALRDRKGAAALLARAMDRDDNPYGATSHVEIAVTTLGLPAARKLLAARASRAASFEDHLAFARAYHDPLQDPKARDRHLAEAAGRAREPFQVRDLAQFLRESGLDLERADQIIEGAMAAVKDVAGWIDLTHYKPGDPTAYFYRHWPRAEAMAGPGTWHHLITQALGFQDPKIVRTVLEAFDRGRGDAYDGLRAAEEWHALGEPEREAAAIERAALEGADAGALADAWARAGRREKAVALLPDVEAAAAGDLLALARCAQAWHDAGDVDRARACLERATAAAVRPEDVHACATVWRNVFGEVKRADSLLAALGPAANEFEPKLPGFLAGIRDDAGTNLAEMPMGPAPVGF